MTDTVVIDASVAAKWCLPAAGEPFAGQAVHLLSNYAAGQLRFILPDLFWSELGNILWKAVRLGRCTASHAGASLTALLGREFETIPSASLLTLAFGLATAYRRTVYDCLYVSLAIHAKADLITADERLANSLAAHLPVKWLGAL